MEREEEEEKEGTVEEDPEVETEQQIEVLAQFGGVQDVRAPPGGVKPCQKEGSSTTKVKIPNLICGD